jgi:hypothetical protein
MYMSNYNGHDCVHPQNGKDHLLVKIELPTIWYDNYYSHFLPGNKPFEEGIHSKWTELTSIYIISIAAIILLRYITEAITVCMVIFAALHPWTGLLSRNLKPRKLILRVSLTFHEN